MESGYVSDLFSEDGGGGDDPAPSFAYTNVFRKVFPFYLSIGMSYEQFWEMDVELVTYYRKAWKLKRDMRNQDLWLQGAYIYEALLDVVPVMHAFAKKGAKPVPYRDKPYELYDRPKDKKNAEQNEGDKKAKAYMQMFALAINKKFEKGGGANG